MFQPGDLVVYGVTGVCRVEEICKPNLNRDPQREYYLLKPLYQDGVIYSPVDNTKLPIRHIITAQEAEELIDAIPSFRAEASRANTLQALAQHYQSMVRSSDHRDLVEMVMSIYTKQQQAAAQHRRLGSLDEQYMKQAERLLYGELAAALSIPFDEVQPYIARRAAGKA